MRFRPFLVGRLENHLERRPWRTHERPAERAQLCELAQREPPPARLHELWLAIGRRAGKDSVATAVATWLAVFGNFSRKQRRGERATVLCLACDRSQSGIVFGYIKGNFEIPLLAPLVERLTEDTIELKTGVVVCSHQKFPGHWWQNHWLRHPRTACILAYR